MCARKWNIQIVHLAHSYIAPEDKTELDNNGNSGRTEHLPTLKLFKQKETYK